MKSTIAAAVLIVATLKMAAYAEAATGTAAANQTHIVKKSSPRRPARAPRSSNHEVTYDRDAKDPNVGWRTQGSMRVCTQDCDNPEIPGSGYTCRDVNVLGMAMRECDSSTGEGQNRGISGNATRPA
jgi:hypothetical protein